MRGGYGFRGTGIGLTLDKLTVKRIEIMPFTEAEFIRKNIIPVSRYAFETVNWGKSATLRWNIYKVRTIKGPSIFLSQFISDTPPFNQLNTLAQWAADLGYQAVQIPTHLPAIFDLAQAAKTVGGKQFISGRSGISTSGINRPCDLFRGAGLALFLLMASPA